MFALALTGCLLDEAGYLARRDELTDHDGDGFPRSDDCDDTDPAVNPEASETCDATDQDCDGVVDDDAIDQLIWYADEDGDGFGADTTAVLACEAPATTWTNRGGDCDDGDSRSSPTATEIPYDQVDEDCDGSDLVDVDGDGYAGTEAGGSDCDDTDSGSFPGATDDPYDGIDQDCAEGDENDLDSDGYVGEPAGGDDCNDSDPEVFPGAEETWANGYTDNDCDGDFGAAILEYGGSAWTGSPGSMLGTSVARCGDLDGDGLGEYLANAPYESTEYPYGGAVYALSGAGGGSVSGVAHLVAGGASWFLGDGLGAGPDLDGDGTTDLVIAAAGYADGAGASWIVSGSAVMSNSGAEPADVAFGSVLGEEAGWYSGSNATFLGDVTGDGSVRLAIGAPLASPGGMSLAGEVALFDPDRLGDVVLSDADQVLDGYYPGAQFGDSVAPAGDIDGDGIEDYFVGFDAGDVAVILPGGLSAPNIPNDAIFRLTGTGVDQLENAQILGDIDGDGANDIGCLLNEHTFRFYTSLAASPVQAVDEQVVAVETEDGAFGTEPRDLGDLDGDGRDETVLPLTWLPAYHTSVAVIAEGAALTPGTHDLSELPLQALATRSNASFGHHALEVGDVDGDGQSDLLLAGPDDDAGGEGAGAVLAIPLPQ